MKKLTLITGIILITCVSISAAAQQPVDAPQRQLSATAPSGYVIKDSGGAVAVYRQGEDTPIFITRTRTDSLPRSDSRRVKEGIEVESDERLRQALEDFCS